MYKFIATVAALLVMQVPNPAFAQTKNDCPLIAAWSEVPEPIRSDLITRVGRIARKGEQFNATDVVSGDRANNRFLTGCTKGTLLAVALERGGRGFRVQVFQFKSGKFADTWTQHLDKNGSVTVELVQSPAAR